MKITYLGHNTHLIETRSKRILTDPFITPNPLAKEIDVDALVPDCILLTHAHGDHVADVERLAANKAVTIISSYEIVSYYADRDCLGHGMNIGGAHAFEWGTVKMVNALHSSVFPDGTYGGNPAGFVVWNEEGCLYIAGDTALTLDMKLIPDTCPTVDLAILPIGDNFTMGVDDAAIAADFVKCKRVLGCHYNTFDGIRIDEQKAIQTFQSRGIPLLLLNIGETIEV